MRKTRVKAIKATVAPPVNKWDIPRYKKDYRRAKKDYYHSRRTDM